jgi:hypothetical protein
LVLAIFGASDRKRKKFQKTGCGSKNAEFILISISLKTYLKNFTQKELSAKIVRNSNESGKFHVFHHSSWNKFF